MKRIGAICIKILDAIVGVFSEPRCRACQESMEDMGYMSPGLDPEPIYVCVNGKCEKHYQA